MSKCCGNKYDDVQVNFNNEGFALVDPSYDPEFPFGESKATFENEEFWQEVRDEKDKGIDRVSALRIIRVRKLQEKVQGDLLVDLITIKHDTYFAWCEKNGGMDMYPTFVFELSQLIQVILEEDFAQETPTHLKHHELADGTQRTILHLAAERNLVDVMQLLLTKEKGIAVVTTYPDNHYPLYYALQKNHDGAACKLIQHMANVLVRDLFGDNESEEDLPTFRFCDVITNGNMKKTVEAILDCLMNPNWPFMPIPKEAGEEDSKGLVLPNTPFRYHFFYRLLDGDDEGQPAKKEGAKNPEFNLNKTKSCLQLIAENSNSEDSMLRHPVVRMLMLSKWNKFGKFWITTHASLYALFLIMMSIALLMDSSTRDRTEYTTNLDYFRLFCEIATLVFTFHFIVDEVIEVIRGKVSYLYDTFNYFDVTGLVLILAIIPLRFTKCTSSEFAVSAAAYLINVLRLSKYATVAKSMSIYLKTLNSIITREVSRFAILFVVFWVAYSGAVFLALKWSNHDMLNTVTNSSGYWLVFLQELRSLAEANGFAETETYLSMHVIVIILLMVNMFLFIVVLNNILIAQIGNSFSEAQNDAKIKFDIDRTKLITRIEDGPYFLPGHLRSTHYVDREFLNNSLLEGALLEDWAVLKERSENIEKRKADIKLLITKIHK